MLSYRFDSTRGSMAIDWSVSSCGGPPLDPPEEDANQDQSLGSDADESDCCGGDFATSVEPD